MCNAVRYFRRLQLKSYLNQFCQFLQSIDRFKDNKAKFVGSAVELARPDWEEHREEIKLKTLVSDNIANSVTYVFRYFTGMKWKLKAFSISVDCSYMFDSGAAIYETGTLSRDGTFSSIKGLITFGLYGRVIQLEYTKAHKADLEYEVLLQIGMWFLDIIFSTMKFNWFFIFLLQRRSRRVLCTCLPQRDTFPATDCG